MAKETLYLDYAGLKAYHEQIKPYLVKQMTINGQTVNATGVKFADGEYSSVSVDENGIVTFNVTGLPKAEEIATKEDIKDFITSSDIPSHENFVTKDEIGRIPEVDINELFGLFSASTSEKLLEALAAGGEITLLENITLDETKTEKSDRNYTESDTTVSLLDKVITIPANRDSNSVANWSGLWVGNNAEMTIEASTGGIVVSEEAKDNYEGPFCVTVGSADGSESGKLVIKGGNFIANSCCVYVMTGLAEIYGGHFEIIGGSANMDKNNIHGGANAFVLNCYDKNYANGTADIKVFGGEFVNFNPAGPHEADADKNRHGFVAEGYHVEESDLENGNKLYTVVKD